MGTLPEILKPDLATVTGIIRRSASWKTNLPITAPLCLTTLFCAFCNLMLQKALFFMEYNMSISSVINHYKILCAKMPVWTAMRSVSSALLAAVFENLRCPGRGAGMEQDNYQYPIPQRYLWRGWAQTRRALPVIPCWNSLMMICSGVEKPHCAYR